MNWNARIIDGATVDAGAPLSMLVEALFEQQIETWAQLREGIEALERVECRSVGISGVSVSLQHNPQRMVSTSARVDDQSIRERPCFLCSRNMPADEKGLAFGDDLMVFCNPFPVLARHMVILAREHIPQELGGHVGQFLDLAASLGRDYATLYNGAKCGASAPDHLHFQAGRFEGLSIFDEIEEEIDRHDTSGVRVSDAYGVGFIWFSSRDRERALLTIESLMETLRTDGTESEPMVNLLARHDGADWLVVVIPRRKHRPASYFAEGEAKVLVSPAAIDLAGLLVVPRKKDFERLDAPEVRGIFAEVTLTAPELAALVAGVSGRRPVEAGS